MANVPNRQTSEEDLNQFNIWMRSQPWFIEWHRQRGLNPSGNGNRKLSRDEQGQLERLMQQNGVPLDGGMHIDSGGSANQKNRLVRNAAITAAVVGGSILTAGAAGMGPAAGLFGSTAPIAAPAATALPTLASTTVPTLATAAPTLAGASTIGGTVAAGTTAATAAPSLFGRAVDYLRSPQGFNDVGRMVGSATNQAAQNRQVQNNDALTRDQIGLRAENDYQTQLLAREKDERESQADAYAKAMRATHANSYAPGIRPEGVPSRGYNFAPGEQGKAAADELYREAMKRLVNGDQLPPLERYQVTPYQNAGRMEQVGNYAAPALGLFGQAVDFYNRTRR